jgi:hypothetical protein
LVAHTLTQQRQLCGEFIEHRREPLPRGFMRGVNRGRIAVRTNHDVDRAVLEMPAVPGQWMALSGHACYPSIGGKPSGHAFESVKVSMRRPVGAPSLCHAPRASTSASGRTYSM